MQQTISNNQWYDFDRLDYGALTCRECSKLISEGENIHFNPKEDNNDMVCCSIECLDINLKNKGFIQ